MKKAEITLDQAIGWYHSNYNLKHVLETYFPKEELEGKAELTKKWEELGICGGYYLSGSSIIKHPYGPHANIVKDKRCLFATESQAKSALAFAQLSQIAREANERVGWISDWKDDDKVKYTIIRRGNILVVDGFIDNFFHITFYSYKAAEESLIKHKELWKDYWELG